MTILDETRTAPQRADLEFVLEQLATLEPAALAAEETGCNGCNHCSVVLD
jgi:hypothetical protein